MITVPDLKDDWVVFGSIKHLPDWKDMPEEFQRNRWDSPKNVWCVFVHKWFFDGLDPDNLGILAKEGVDQRKAMKAISALLRSWDCQHEHKIAGAGFLLSQWFDMTS